MNENAEIIQNFVMESQDMLDDVEPQFIELESDGDTPIDEELVNSIFRLFHTMKGSAGFLEFNNLQCVTHEAETLLDVYRKGKLVCQAEHIQVLLRTCDFLRTLLDNISRELVDTGFEDEAQALVNALQAITSGSGAAKAATEATPPAAAPAPETLPADSNGGVSSLISAELVDQYVRESLDLLDNLEQSFLALESDPSNKDLINTAFREIHTFKGNSGLLGYADLERLSHKTEGFLDHVRCGELEDMGDNASLILKIVDVMRDGVNDIAQGKSGTVPACSVMLELMEESFAESYEKAGIVTEDSAMAPTPEPEAAPEAVAVEPSVAVETATAPPPPEATTSEAAPSPPAEKPTPAKAKKEAPVALVRKDIRVDVAKVDMLVDLVGELALAKTMVLQNVLNITSQQNGKPSKHRTFDRTAHQLDRIVSELQFMSLSLRMIPIAGTFRKMVRLVHDLSRKSGKKVDLKMTGEETEVDKTVIDQIADPLVHIIRNSLDHGLEMPEDRKDAGKDMTGTVSIEAKHEGGEVHIVIQDDGRGLNREKILAKAVQNGLCTGDGRDLTDSEVFKFIFEPGFSTAEKVTEVSGRGVGMDVVRRNLEKLKGTVDIASTLGEGTTVTLRIPLTLAIIEGMLIEIGKSRYTLPLGSIRESLKPKMSDITVSVDGQEVIQVRGQLLPIIRLGELLETKGETLPLEEGLLVTVEYRGESYCLAVDKVLGQQQAVIKGLSDYIGSVDGVSGCTILGDGEVSLILDVGGLIHKATTRVSKQSRLAATDAAA